MAAEAVVRVALARAAPSVGCRRVRLARGTVGPGHARPVSAADGHPRPQLRTPPRVAAVPLGTLLPVPVPRFAAKAHRLVTVSKASARDLADTYGLLQDDITVVPNARPSLRAPVQSWLLPRFGNGIPGANGSSCLWGPCIPGKTSRACWRAFGRYVDREGFITSSSWGPPCGTRCPWTCQLRFARASTVWADCPTRVAQGDGSGRGAGVCALV